jgi:DNA invertase Pin-like site-specific DNA recombinase
VAGVPAGLAVLELELGRERRAAARDHDGRGNIPSDGLRHFDNSKAAVAQWMHAGGESASTIAATLGVGRATVYRVLAEQAEDTNR